MARSIAPIWLALKALSASLNSRGVTRMESSRTSSNFSVSANTAASPSRLTVSMMPCAAAATSAASRCAGRRKASRRSDAVSDFQSRIRTTMKVKAYRRLDWVGISRSVKNRTFFPQPPWARRMRRAGGHGWPPRACAQQGLRSAMDSRRSGKCPPKPASEHEKIFPSCQHLLDGEHQHRRGPRALELFESFPEHVFAAHRVHRHAVSAALERNDGRRLAARQEFRDGRQRGAGRMQHDVLAALDLLDAVDAHQQAPGPLLLFRRDRHRCADQRGLTLEYRLCLAQMICRQRGSGRYEIANQIRAAEPRRNFHGAGENHDLRGNAAVRQKAIQDMR